MHRDALSVGFDDDTTVQIGAVEAQLRNGSQSRERLCPWMAVVVSAAARDHRYRGPKLAQLPFQPRILGAVMCNLQDLDAAREESSGHLRLGIGGQERIG